MPKSVPTTRVDANAVGDFADDLAIPRSGGVKDAAYRIARGYPGGIRALAARMEMPYDTFQKKVSPSCETHHLQLEEAVDMQVYAGRCDILYAMAADLGHICLTMPDESMGDLGMRLMSVGEKVGDVFEVARRVMSDGKLTAPERRELTDQIAETVIALMAVLKGK
ncbi:MAG: hypothetical protein EOP38_20500 [Rubrivivax sp.]|nr:MAG: hypothetical protein EOP38_20500 [Rubrivivax sp.]